MGEEKRKGGGGQAGGGGWFRGFIREHLRPHASYSEAGLWRYHWSKFHLNQGWEMKEQLGAQAPSMGSTTRIWRLKRYYHRRRVFHSALGDTQLSQSRCQSPGLLLTFKTQQSSLPHNHKIITSEETLDRSVLSIR